MPAIEVRHCLTPDGRDPFAEWLGRLRDRRAVAAILLRIGRVGDRIVLLLGGGDKRRQDDDIARAKRHWAHYSQGAGAQ